MKTILVTPALIRAISQCIFFNVVSRRMLTEILFCGTLALILSRVTEQILFLALC